LGATGLIWGGRNFFSLINGMDGLSVGPYNSNWPNTSSLSTYNDLFWLPSDFEVRTMGYNKENARNTTLLADVNDRSTLLRSSGESESAEVEENAVDEDGETIEREESAEITENAETEDLHETGRTGLWRLNGFDRAFDRDGLGLPRGWMTRQVWLRSQDSMGIGSVNMVTNTGGRYSYGVHQLAGMRPAVHLSISELISIMN